MNITISEYRARIGRFNNRSSKMTTVNVIDLSYVILTLTIIIIASFVLLSLFLCGDLELNPGPLSTDSAISSNDSISNESDSIFTKQFNSCLSLIHLNIQSICPKLDIINGNLRDFDILCFTESWLDPNVNDSELMLDNFNIPFRHDRQDRAGGGVIVYTKDHLYCKRRHDLEIHGIECVWLEIIEKSQKYLIGTFYRPPNCLNNTWNLIDESIELAIDTQIKNIIITGDFNENQLHKTDTKISNISTNYNLHQLILEPTSITENSATLIDLLITNNPHIIIYSGVCEPFLDVNIRYHRPIVALLHSEKRTNLNLKRKIWLYDQGDYPKLRDKISSMPWDLIFENQIGIDNIVQTVTNTLLEMAAETIPNRIITVRNGDLPWITTELRKLMRKRDRLRKKAKKKNSDYYWSKFKRIRNKVVDSLRAAKRTYHCKLCDKIKANKFGSKDWWNLVKQVSNISQKSHGIKILVSDNDEIITDDHNKANALNNFFASQTYIDELHATLPDLPNHENAPDIPTLDRIVLTERNVEDILKTLDTSKAMGPDLINARILKEASRELSIPLCMLFNTSLQSNIFPSQWKIANVVPVFKKNDPQKVNNYRPISLLCIISKVFEKCIYKYLHNFILDNNLLSSHQSGFRNGDSTINQLLFLYNEFSHALDEGKEVRTVFFDISKAFDRVWHKGLLFKIESLGIKGNLLLWVKSYLSGRKQRVVINGKQSTVLELKAGVPQGSILGPLFFLIFINDIVNDIGCRIKLFADDTSLYIIIEHPDAAAQILNEDLEKVRNWSKTWLVSFNPQKTETLLISRKANQTYHPPLYFDGIPIQEVTNHKHLGLIFNNTCHWGQHIDYIVDKAYKKLNILRSLKFDLDRLTLQIMYFSFIRPVLEYGDIIFDNCPSYYSEKLEKINIEAARIVTGATKLVSINTLYNECGWDTLEKRREKHKLIQFYKMKNCLTPEYLIDLLPPLHRDQHTYNTRNSQNLVSIQCRTTYHFNSFIPSTIRIWNNLPTNIKESNSIHSFKQALSSLNIENNVPPYYYNTGSRRGQILHARLRMRCSSLKQHLYLRNIEPSPLCTCGKVESCFHFLLECTHYDNLRTDMLNSIDAQVSCNLLLYGDPSKPCAFNSNLFKCVENYILQTKRFD